MKPKKSNPRKLIESKINLGKLKRKYNVKSPCKNEYPFQEIHIDAFDDGFNEGIKKTIDILSPQLFHNIYEKEAEKVGWKTHRKCRVDFDELPQLNQETMINTIQRIKQLLEKEIKK